MDLLETILDLLKSGSPLIYISLYTIYYLIKEWYNFKIAFNDLNDKVNRYEANINHINEMNTEKFNHINEKIDEIKEQIKELRK